jgi:long-subunit fatty acid transport protein
MKKIYALLFLGLFISVNVNAQSLLPNKYGIKVGINSANVVSTPLEGVKNIENTSKIGIAGGFYSEFPVNDKWYINPEILYSQMGSSFDYAFTHDYSVNDRQEYNTTNDLAFTYVELNPTVSYKANHKFSLNIGPSVSYLISSDYTYTTSPEHIDAELIDGKIKEESLDVGLNFGVSFYFTENFLLNARTTTGFMTVGEVQRPIDQDDNPAFSIKNRKLFFSLAYLF